MARPAATLFATPAYADNTDARRHADKRGRRCESCARWRATGCVDLVAGRQMTCIRTMAWRLARRLDADARRWRRRWLARLISPVGHAGATAYFGNHLKLILANRLSISASRFFSKVAPDRPPGISAIIKRPQEQAAARQRLSLALGVAASRKRLEMGEFRALTTENDYVAQPETSA